MNAVRERVRDENWPWGVLAVVGCGLLGIVGGLQWSWFVWVRPVEETVHYDLPNLIGLPDQVIAAAGTLGLLAVVAVTLTSRRLRSGAAVWAVTAVIVIGASTDPIRIIADPDITWRYAAGIITLDTAVLGLLGAFVISRSSHRRLAGFVVWLTGAAVIAVSLRYVVATTGTTGFHDDYLFLSVAPFATLGGATLLLVGGALSARVERTSTGRQSSGHDEERSTSRLVPSSIAILAVSGVLGTAVGAWQEWVLVNPALEPADGGPAASLLGWLPIDLSLIGLVTACVLVALATTLRGRRYRLGSWLLVLAGLLAAGVPLLWRTETASLEVIASPGLYVTLCAGGALVVAGGLCYERGRALETVPPSTATTGGSLRAAFPWGPALVALSGAALVAVGTRFAWTVQVPGTSGVTPPGNAGLTIGAAGSNAVLFGLVAVGTVGVVAVATLWHEERGGAVLFGTGLLATAQVTWRIVAATGADGVVEWPLLVGPGAYLTLGGAVTLLLAGAVVHGTAGLERATRHRDDADERPGGATADDPADTSG